jgi:hypothetical protein
MVLADGKGTPLVAMTESATPNEVTLIEPMLRQLRIPKVGRGRPKTRWHRLIYDKAADSDPLRIRLMTKGTRLICPHRSNRVKPPGWQADAGRTGTSPLSSPLENRTNDHVDSGFSPLGRSLRS